MYKNNIYVQYECMGIYLPHMYTLLYIWILNYTLSYTVINLLAHINYNFMHITQLSTDMHIF
jgi:hypothetical protein